MLILFFTERRTHSLALAKLFSNDRAWRKLSRTRLAVPWICDVVKKEDDWDVLANADDDEKLLVTSQEPTKGEKLIYERMRKDNDPLSATVANIMIEEEGPE
eukprot:845369_1